MSPWLVRRLVIAVCALGIAGMIVGSITEKGGLALTSGLTTAAASLCLIVATAVGAGAPARTGEQADEQAARVEEQVAALVGAGAHEGEVRALVRSAVQLGRATATMRRNHG